MADLLKDFAADLERSRMRMRARLAEIVFAPPTFPPPAPECPVFDCADWHCRCSFDHERASVCLDLGWCSWPGGACRQDLVYSEWPISLGLSIRRFVRRAEVTSATDELRFAATDWCVACCRAESTYVPNLETYGERLRAAIDRLAQLAMEGHGDG